MEPYRSVREQWPGERGCFWLVFVREALLPIAHQCGCGRRSWGGRGYICVLESSLRQEGSGWVVPGRTERTFERRDPFPACLGNNSRRSRRNSRGGALHRKGERNFRVVPPFPESPRCLSPFQEYLFSLHCLDFQAEDRLTPRWHVGQPCGKAS